MLDGLSDDQIAVLEQIEPWTAHVAICDRRSSDPACAACTAPDCGLRQKDAA